MIFGIYFDSGDRVFGTVIPDTYSGSCRVRATVLGREVGVFPTDELNQGARDVGMHETGLVNFSITEEKLPGLSTFEDLELHEADSNLLLYRRLRPGMISQKFLRLETQLLPLWRLDEAVKHRFQQYYRGIEALGRSGTTQVFHLLPRFDLLERANTDQELHVSALTMGSNSSRWFVIPTRNSLSVCWS